ncbi:MAG: glycosyltransferase family 39 protein [Bacteroidetes bacterium]|nr:glycosyltransferase family 39 protein [Bacteroidota bacterium]
MKQKKQTELFSFWLPLMGLTVVAGLRFLFLDANDVAMDEPFTIFFAQADLHTLFGMLPKENNPPLYFLVMHFWTGWFGISAFSVRFLSCVFGILTAVMLYKTGKDFFSQPVGFFAAALFTLSDYHQLFAHEARVYALFALLTTVSMYLFLTLTTGSRKRRTLLLLAVTNILLIYSHFFGFFIFLIQGLSVLIISDFRKTVLKPYLVSVFICFMAYIPWLPVLISRFSQSAGEGTWVKPPVISDLYTMVWRYLNAPVVTVVVLCILTAALIRFILGIRNGTEKWNKRSAVLIIWFLAPYFLMFFASFQIPMFLDRYTVFISVGFYLLTAVALSSLLKRTKPLLIVMSVFIIMMAVTFHPRVDNKRRLKEAVSFIRENWKPGTCIIICPSWLQYGFAYHYNQLIFKDYAHLPMMLNRECIYPVNDLSSLDTNKLKQADRVLFFEEWASLTDPGQTLFTYLNREFRAENTRSFYENFKVHQYIK